MKFQCQDRMSALCTAKPLPPLAKQLPLLVELIDNSNMCRALETTAGPTGIIEKVFACLLGKLCSWRGS